MFKRLHIALVSSRPKIGAHVSVAGGLYRGIEHALGIGAECIQIFGASPQQWKATLPKAEEVERYKNAAEAGGIGPVYLHAAYLVNLSSPVAAQRERSAENLSMHLAIAHLIGAAGLIFHVGSAKGSTKTSALDAAVAGMKAVLKRVPGKTQLVIENAAGGGEKLGATPEEIGAMIEGVGSERIKVCIDTAHAFEAGLIARYLPEAITLFLDRWDKAVGIERIVALHVNDSKTAYNSRHDRHENIGQGYIGIDGFKNLAKEKRLWDKAWILEVPGFAGEGPDRKNIEMLKKCFDMVDKKKVIL